MIYPGASVKKAVQDHSDITSKKSSFQNFQDVTREKAGDYVAGIVQESKDLPLKGHVFVCFADMTKIACDGLVAINVVTHYHRFSSGVRLFYFHVNDCNFKFR